MAELDVAYANADFIPNAKDFPPRWAGEAEAFRTALGPNADLDIQYGPSPRQAYDLFLPKTTPHGLMIFVHGGYWLRFDRSYWSHFAGGCLARGWAVGMPSYDVCPDVRISDITQQIAAAVSQLAQRVAGPITLAGHSAGGHLVARMLAPGMLADDVRNRLARVVPISPLSDLRPLLRTSMNDHFQMTEHHAWSESPIAQAAPSTPVTVWVGADERPVFLEQAAWLSEAWGTDHVIAPMQHHFDVIEPLSDPDSDMVRLLTP